jgi:hypothetical protein
MGGSGSVGWTPSVPSDPCDKLSFVAIVNSPQPAVIAKLSQGDLLNVKLQATPQTVVVVEYQGAVAGTLAGVQVTRLINCLQNGYEYNAKVISVVGGKCTIEVGPI